MKKIILCFLVSGIVTWSFCQSIPDIGNDPGWVLNPGMSDEFNSGTTFNNTKWTWTPGYHPLWPDNEYATHAADNACNHNSAGVISIASEGSTSFMRLGVIEEYSYCDDTEGNTYLEPYAIGNLIGLNQQQYGYFTIRFRSPIPAGYPMNTHNGISANAWLWRSHDPANGIWSEIDLCEMDCSNNRHTSNVHFDPNEYDVPNSHLTSPGNHAILVTGWHTYSVSWFPNGIAIYFDGALINQTYIGCPGMEELNWIMGPGSAIGQFGTGITPFSNLPYYMDIDYVRTYYLNTNCDNQELYQPSYNVNTYDGNHKKSIIFGGGGYSTSVTAGSSIYMKATDFIQIEGTFTVPVGATFVADVLPCM